MATLAREARPSARSPKRPAALTRLTPEGKVLLAFVWSFCALSILMRENLLLLLGSLVLGSLACAWPFVRGNLSRVRLGRELPARAQAGQRVALGWVVENRGRREAVGLVAHDPLDGVSRPAAVEAAFPVVAPGARAEATAWVAFERRGLRRLRPPWLWTSFPLGVFSLEREESASVLLVRPKEGVATRALLARLRGDAGAATTLEVRRTGLDRFHGLREFRDGDDPRRIHWRTTARRGVRTFAEWRAESGRHVFVVLGKPVERGRDGERRFERAVSVAATVVSACARERLPVRLLLGRAPRERDRGAPERGLRGFEASLDALALVRTAEDRAPLDDLASLRRGSGPRTVVWVSSGPEAGVDARLAEAAGAGAITLRLRADEPSVGRWVRGIR